MGVVVDFDVERSGPFRHAHEDARRRILREVARVDRVDGLKVLRRSAVDVALHHVVERRARGLEAKFHLFKNEFGLAPHTDTSFMTLLAQNRIPGLSLRAPEGRWIDAPALPGTFLVNGGDLLRRWTNDRFLATPHRVLNRFRICARLRR